MTPPPGHGVERRVGPSYSRPGTAIRPQAAMVPEDAPDGRPLTAGEGGLLSNVMGEGAFWQVIGALTSD